MQHQGVEPRFFRVVVGSGLHEPLHHINFSWCIKYKYKYRVLENLEQEITGPEKCKNPKLWAKIYIEIQVDSRFFDTNGFGRKYPK
jgi:hypothetical protein